MTEYEEEMLQLRKKELQIEKKRLAIMEDERSFLLRIANALEKMERRH